MTSENHQQTSGLRYIVPQNLRALSHDPVVPGIHSHFIDMYFWGIDADSEAVIKFFIRYYCTFSTKRIKLIDV